MKKNLRKFKILTVVLTMMLIASAANAADRYAVVATGNWNQTTTWSTTNGGAPGASVPVAGDNVFIPANYNITVTANAACTALTFTIITNPSPAGTLTVNTGFTLAVSGAVIKNNETQTSSQTTITGGGTLTCASFTVGGTNTTIAADHTITLVSTIANLTISGNLNLRGEDDGPNDQNTTFNLASGTVNVGGTIDTDEENGSVVTMSLNTGAETGTLNLSGATPFTNTVGTLGFDATGTGATVNYTRNGAQTLLTTTYTNLGISGSGIKTTAADITITGDLLVASGGTLALGANDLTIDVNANRSATIDGTLNIDGNGRLLEAQGGTKTLVLGPNSFLNITDFGGSTLPAYNAFTFDPTSTVVYGATDNQTVENTPTYGNLTVSGGSTKALETSGGAMTFAGNVLIVAGTTLDGNDKTINVGGDFIKNGSFTQANTTLVLNGTAAQSLRGSSAIALNNLTINNTIAGSVIAVTVDTIINIAGVATFTDGIVSTSTTEYLAFADNATVGGAGLSQATDASFVAGPVLKTGNDAFVFPVGALVTATGGGYMPLTITAPDNVADALSCEYVRGNATAIQTNGFTAPILNVSKCDYWNLNEVNDAGGPGGVTTISVTLSWDGGSPCNNKPFITNVSALTVAHFNSGTSKWEQAGTGGPAPSGTPTTGSVTRTGVSVFSPFSLGNTLNGANPLPVTFFDVKAFEKNNGVQVEWVNLTEKDLASYSVERSVNGRDFTAISTLAARSNQNDAQSYNNFDASPFAGTSFYRIKAVEVDGKISYSKLLKVEIGKTQKGIVLYPNPVTGSDLTIGFTAVKGQYTLGVVNSVGQKVFTQTLSHQGGTVSQSISLPASVKPGMYTMLLTGDNYRETKIFVIQ